MCVLSLSRSRVLLRKIGRRAFEFYEFLGRFSGLVMLHLIMKYIIEKISLFYGRYSFVLTKSY